MFLCILSKTEVSLFYLKAFDFINYTCVQSRNSYASLEKVNVFFSIPLKQDVNLFHLEKKKWRNQCAACPININIFVWYSIVLILYIPLKLKVNTLHLQKCSIWNVPHAQSELYHNILVEHGYVCLYHCNFE